MDGLCADLASDGPDADPSSSPEFCDDGIGFGANLAIGGKEVDPSRVTAFFCNGLAVNFAVTDNSSPSPKLFPCG